MSQLERVASTAVGDVVARSRQTIVAYGGGKFLPSVPSRPAPTTRLQREMERHFRVAPMDEHRTSNSCTGLRRGCATTAVTAGAAG
jgi:hypothetical protein